MLITGFIYFAFLAFIGLSLYKFYQYAKMPMHSRWELYPLPKESAKRSHYGGSYYEEPEWWKKNREVSHTNEIKEMLKEMLFIKILFDNNRSHWFVSYPMHLAFYLLGLWIVLLAGGAVAEIYGANLADSNTAIVKLLNYGISITGGAGLILMAVGSAGLLLKRIFNNNFNKYTTPVEYFNVIFVLTVAISGIAAWSVDPSFGYAVQAMKSILTVSPIEAGTAFTVHILLAGGFLIYIPQTKMTHYVGKYFAFHKVLWENEPNLRNSKIEQVIKKASSYKPSIKWSAPHINSDAQDAKNK